MLYSGRSQPYPSTNCIVQQYLRPVIFLHFLPNYDLVVKAAGGQDAAKLGMAPGHLPHRPFVALQVGNVDHLIALHIKHLQGTTSHEQVGRKRCTVITQQLQQPASVRFNNASSPPNPKRCTGCAGATRAWHPVQARSQLTETGLPRVGLHLDAPVGRARRQPPAVIVHLRIVDLRGAGPRSSKLQATKPALGARQPHAAPGPGARSRRRPPSSPSPAPPALTRAAACCSRRPPPPRDSRPPGSPLQPPRPKRRRPAGGPPASAARWRRRGAGRGWSAGNGGRTVASGACALRPLPQGVTMYFSL